jgi:hypothetical protein
VYVLWGIMTTLVWAGVLADAYGQWKEQRDRRARRELLSTASLFITALGSTAAILMIFFGEPGSAPRQVVLGVALGMFTGAGLVLLGSRKGMA